VLLLSRAHLTTPGVAVCSSPATRMFVALSAALGHEFTPQPSKSRAPRSGALDRREIEPPPSMRPGFS
jgi:hypothetical protein